MRTTLTLDDEIYQTIDAMAKSSGKRLGEVVSELLRQRLHPSPTLQHPQEDDGFDFITFPATGRVTMRAADVKRILEEEGP
ncbi:ribbon-helix-helix domain-containing protein [Luteolibacter sp. Populi]|uniref:ribbon-helix-helix domain-containing protein n=1 Tax=Luteolibacter sp. Populi TaxID=3230487 RepID=UPI0034678E8C